MRCMRGHVDVGQCFVMHCTHSGAMSRGLPALIHGMPSAGQAGSSRVVTLKEQQAGSAAKGVGKPHTHASLFRPHAVQVIKMLLMCQWPCRPTGRWPGCEPRPGQRQKWAAVGAAAEGGWQNALLAHGRWAGCHALLHQGVHRQ